MISEFLSSSKRYVFVSKNPETTLTTFTVISIPKLIGQQFNKRGTKGKILLKIISHCHPSFAASSPKYSFIARDVWYSTSADGVNENASNGKCLLVL